MADSDKSSQWWPGVRECLCILWEWRVLSLIAVCGNGTHSGERIIHYHEDKLLQAEVPCLCALPWGEEETSHINPQKAVWRPSRKRSRGLGFPWKWYAGQQSRDTFEFIYKILFHFIWEFPGCGAKFWQLFCRLVICLVTWRKKKEKIKKKKKKKKEIVKCGKRWKATQWEDRKGIERGKEKTSHPITSERSHPF